MTKVNDEEQINKEINDKLIELCDEIEEKYDCEAGYIIKIGNVFIDNNNYDLYLQFGFTKYFSIIGNVVNERSIFVNNISIYNFELLPAQDLCENIKELLKTIDKKHIDNINNKKDFLKLINKK